LSAGFEFFLAALEAAGVTLRFGDDIYAHLATVFAAGRAGAMLLAQRAAGFALHQMGSDQSMMAPALCGLRPVPAHSNYHGENLAQPGPENK